MAIYAKLVPSSSKEIEWKSYAKMLERNLPIIRGAARELKLLHRHFSNGTNHKLLHDEKEEIIRLMHFIDRPDLDREGFEKLRLKAGRHPLHMLSFPLVEFERELGKCVIQFRPSIRGHLRSYGIRRIRENNPRIVYASHTFAPNDNPDPKNPNYAPPVYFGLSTNLNLVYEALCWKYDSIFAQAKTLDDKLLAESYLHLVGTHLLHPFWDGNGRTFTAHLALMLAREGILVKEYEHIRQITVSLIDIDGKFLDKVLDTLGIELILPDRHSRMLFDIDFRKRYMTRLRAAIADAIDHGTNPKGPYFDDYLNAKETMRSWLEDVKAGVDKHAA